MDFIVHVDTYSTTDSYIVVVINDTEFDSLGIQVLVN